MPTAAATVHQPRERIRVLYCLDTLGVGGSELNAIRTAERLDPARFQVVVACLRASGALRDRYQSAGIPIHEFPAGSLWGPGMLVQGMRLVRLLASYRPHIVHCHDFYSNVFGAPWARAANVPVVITSRRWWHLLPSRPMRHANRVADRLAHYILTNSPTLASSLRTREGVAAGRLLVLPNFVDDDAFEQIPVASRLKMLAELGVPQEALVVGTVARLVSVKDFPVLLRAAALLANRYPELHVVLVGDGACRLSLESLARDLGVRSRVHFAGTRANQPNLHGIFDVSVLCSRSEGFPNTILEAMAASRPVVATAVGGCVDAVADGTTGFLVPPGSPPALADGIARLLDSPLLRRRMGQAARQCALERFHATRVVSHLQQLYDGLTAGARA